MKFRRILTIIKKELIQTFRDKKMMRMIFVIPIVQLFLFGYAVKTDVNDISTAIIDEDRTSTSREFIQKFRGSGYFRFTAFLDKSREIDKLMENGEIQFALRIPKGFEESVSRKKTAVLQTIVDGVDSTTARIIGGYVSEITRDYSVKIALERMERMKSLAPKVPVVYSAVRIWYNPELKSVWFMIPGVLCTILLIVTTSMTSMAIVKEKELGTLEQLVVTPIKPLELMIGKTVPFLLIGIVMTVFILLIATFWFEVVPVGNLAFLFASTLIFLLTSLGLGTYVSTVSQTQQEASLTTFFFMLPSVLLSGFIFPIENMPLLFQYLTYIIPQRYFLEVMRGIYLKGNTLAILSTHLTILAIFAAVILLLSARRFSKRLG